MKKSSKNFPAGPNGWGVQVTAGASGVEVAITGPQRGHYPGDWMTPEQAEELGLGLIHKAQESRDKAAARVAV
jgi:hypothetical protein